VLTDQIFTEQTIHRILKVITVQYFVLTTEEVELWRDDPLKFYMDAK